MQEVFLLVWRHPERFDPARGSVSAWLMTMVHHRSVDAVRREATRRRHTVPPGEEGEDWNLPPGPGADEAALDAVVAGHVREALAALPAEQREALTLAYFGGFTQREVASISGIPLGTVKSRMFTGGPDAARAARGPRGPRRRGGGVMSALLPGLPGRPPRARRRVGAARPRARRGRGLRRAPRRLRGLPADRGGDRGGHDAARVGRRARRAAAGTCARGSWLRLRRSPMSAMRRRPDATAPARARCQRSVVAATGRQESPFLARPARRRHRRPDAPPPRGRRAAAGGSVAPPPGSPWPPRSRSSSRSAGSWRRTGRSPSSATPPPRRRRRASRWCR